MPSIHDLPAIDRLFKRERLTPHQLRLVRNTFYKQRRPADVALERLPADPRRRLNDEIRFHTLDLHLRHDSQVDGASKLIFRTAQGFLIESVILRIASGRTALCVSSQVGCAANCSFCATGKMGLAHDLSASEILDQLAQANLSLAEEGRRVRIVVFMGMGEPFHNETNLCDALEVLQSSRCFDLSPRQIVVSTVGIPDAMERFARRFPQTRLALSLHCVRPEVRESIVPLARKHDLAELREALHQVARIQQQTVMIEYLLLEGLTDTAEDFEALGRFLDGIPVHVNLIPYNPIDGAPALRGTSRARREEFGAALRNAGFKVTLRYSLGADIAAACGQLVQRENRQIARASVTPLTAARRRRGGA